MCVVVCLSTTKVIIHYTNAEYKLIGKYTCSSELSGNGCLEWPRTLTKEIKMAKGFKIAHIQSDGTTVDQNISTTVTSLGGVGGIPQWITTTGVKTVKVQFRDSTGILHTNAYIISQKGATKFLVANAVGAVEGHTQSNASITTCTIAAGSDAANGTPSSSASTMSITGYDTSSTLFYASRITNKYVYDQSNNKYSYRTAGLAATATYANVIAH